MSRALRSLLPQNIADRALLTVHGEQGCSREQRRIDAAGCVVTLRATEQQQRSGLREHSQRVEIAHPKRVFVDAIADTGLFRQGQDEMRADPQRSAWWFPGSGTAASCEVRDADRVAAPSRRRNLEGLRGPRRVVRSRHRRRVGDHRQDRRIDWRAGPLRARAKSSGSPPRGTSALGSLRSAGFRSKSPSSVPADTLVRPAALPTAYGSSSMAIQCETRLFQSGRPASAAPDRHAPSTHPWVLIVQNVRNA